MAPVTVSDVADSLGATIAVGVTVHDAAQAAPGDLVPSNKLRWSTYHTLGNVLLNRLVT